MRHNELPYVSRVLFALAAAEEIDNGRKILVFENEKDLYGGVCTYSATKLSITQTAFDFYPVVNSAFFH